MTTREKIIGVIMAAALFLTAPAHADVLSEMENFWRGAAVNTTGPTAFDGQGLGPLDARQFISTRACEIRIHRDGEPAPPFARAAAA